jgi:hypothetical protein
VTALFYERTDSTDDVAGAIGILENSVERLPKLP